MTFTITYRSQSGALQREVVEAANRAAALEQVKSRGITPVSVKEGGTIDAVKTVAQPTWIKGAVAGLVVVVAAVIAFFCLMPTEKPAAPKVEKPKKVKVEKPIAQKVTRQTSQPREARVEAVDRSVLPIKGPRIVYKDSPTNGMSDAEIRKWKILNRPPPGYTNTTSLTEAPPKYAIFRHRSENEIACLLTLRPGDGLVGNPKYGDGFKKDFLKSLETPILTEEGDSDDDVQLKKAMIDTKIELKQRMDAGEDLGQILNDTRREYQSLARYKQNLESELRKLAREGGSQQDVDDFIVAANRILEEKGIAPLKLGPISRRMLMMRKASR